MAIENPVPQPVYQPIDPARGVSGTFLADGPGRTFYLTLADDDRLRTPGAAWAMNAWVHRNDTTPADTLFAGFGVPDDSGSRYFGLEGGYPTLRLGTQQRLVGPEPLTAGQWHLLVASFDGITLTLYVDGTPVATDTAMPGDTLAAQIQLAPSMLPSDEQQHFSGKIEDFTVLRYALGEREVKRLWAEDGYALWLRYPRITDQTWCEHYRAAITALRVEGDSATMQATRQELENGLYGMLDQLSPGDTNRSGTLLAGTPANSDAIASLALEEPLSRALTCAGEDGFVIRSMTLKAGQSGAVITANSDIGVLYGAFHLLRRIQTRQSLDELDIVQAPRIQRRVLDHWDNLDGSIERGYAGSSLWHWQVLPDHVSPRLTDYARANASVGINGSVLNNVNADPDILTPTYLQKVVAIADAFRPYGVRVYLSILFSAPMALGGLDTADPLDAEVQAWWADKADAIYRMIPDFGGFLVKANSEGQPGPQEFGRSHAEGANMLAEALAPHGGIVMWRAFVYSSESPEDRTKQAYNEFKPLDGQFDDSVLVQVKNGPLDFQPREPFHPLFGAMPDTPLMMELQITQEYLGQSSDLAYLAPLYREVLTADTWAQGEGSTVARIIDGSLENHQLTGIAGVANTGSDRNWTSHPFGQANWFAFGRLAWDHTLTSAEIADDWLRMTFTNDATFVASVKEMMLASREAVVNYMTPLGLHHIMATGHHYGPGPWASAGRPEWTPAYYHNADAEGLGFDRTASGSDAVSQYHPPVSENFGGLERVPEKYLLWFHHVAWDYRLASGRTLWQALVHHYDLGVDSVRWMQRVWDDQQTKIDAGRFAHVQDLLSLQHQNARWWRDACLRYFQQYSRMPLPPNDAPPVHTLDFYENYDLPSVPIGYRDTFWGDEYR